MKKMVNYFVMVCLSLFMLSACTGKTKPEAAETKVMTPEQMVQRGEYLVTTMGCHDCHSPKIMGAQGPEINWDIMLSGYQANAVLPPIEKSVLEKGWALMTLDLNAAVGPWGVSFAANLTSDQTGIGNWPEENFLRALKQGKYKGIENGRTLLPPMPWQNFVKASDEDLKAIFAFLKSTKPVSNLVPMPISPADIK